MRGEWRGELSDGSKGGSSPVTMVVCEAKGGRGEEGFLLLGAIIAIFLVLLVLSVAAPTMARQLRRDREVEAVHRGNQYVRAIQLYYKKMGHYPGTMKQLEKSNNIRFLRQKYADPITGKQDWRLIHIGEQKTTAKGFFGQPLAGVASSGLGSAASMASPMGTGASPSVFGSPGPGGVAGTSGASGALSTSGAGGAASPGGASSAGTGTPSGSSVFGSGSASGGISSQSATSFTGSGAPFVGIGSSAAGTSMVVLNEQKTYPTWEFIYDPRMEQLKAKVNLLGGGMASSGGTGLGSAGGLGSPSSSSPAPPMGSNPSSPPPMGSRNP